jgi:hypothetical protein
MASRRLRNSGENRRSIASLPRLLAIFLSGLPVSDVAKPMVPALISREPALLVMISTTWRKSALRPLLSVRVAWFEADVAVRRADQAGDGALLHVFRHVEARELVAEVPRELLGEFRFTDAGGSGEEEAAGRLVGLAEPGPGALDRRGDHLHGVALAEHDAVERVLEPHEALDWRPVGTTRQADRSGGPSDARSRPQG